MVFEIFGWWTCLWCMWYSSTLEFSMDWNDVRWYWTMSSTSENRCYRRNWFRFRSKVWIDSLHSPGHFFFSIEISVKYTNNIVPSKVSWKSPLNYWNLLLFILVMLMLILSDWWKRYDWYRCCKSLHRFNFFFF